MCGILGFYLKQNSKINWQNLLLDLYRLSESRGKEASGIAIRHQDKLHVLRHDKPASDLIRSKQFKELLKNIDLTQDDLILTGHTRLVTNGDRSLIANNQPVVSNGIVVIHNGIICNYSSIWRDVFKQNPPSELDTDIIPIFLAQKLKSQSLEEALESLYQVIEGDASICCLFEDRNVLALKTNTGSLYYSGISNEYFVFASQHAFLKKISEKYLASQPVHQLKPHVIKLLSFDQPKKTNFIDLNASQKEKRDLKRCSRCILPESFPGIHFDSKGVCNICHDYVPFQPYGHASLENLCDQHRKKDGSPDCLIAFSGGLDSSYLLHYVKCVLKMNPITYTYDWGVITDLARRNIARMCGKLGVENILVSADIPKKRSYVRKNIEAWLKKPEVGMVTLFMAGDKEFFYHPKNIQKDMNIDLAFFGGNPLEYTSFKSAFCGVHEKNTWYCHTSAFQKLKLLKYFLINFLKNPSYFNVSFFDTMCSFYYSCILKHNYKSFYDYISWNENVILNTLKAEYNWEANPSSDIIWRIGDGTAAFYNYIYFTLAGFTEHETFRSNQIRQGLITREDALKMTREENIIMYDSMQDYARMIGFDLKKAIRTIDNAKKIYV
jgi:glucosamine--fructose-6-phosphate aminotransferase (isomerizing)